MSWKTAFKDALKNTRELESFLGSPLSETDYPIYLPRSYAEKIKNAGPESALWKQFIPHELEALETGLADPIGDKLKAKGRGIVHRYENRILFFPTSMCPIQCRYCFRKNELHHGDQLFIPARDELINFLSDNPQINEVIFSGGDPLVLNDEVLFRWLDVISDFEQVQYIRFHTRMPIILPSRMEPLFLGRLETYHKYFSKIIFVLHCNHADELDQEVESYAKKWQEYSFDFLTQSVLLKGVNDKTPTLQKLFERIVELGWRPYYLHHPDQAKGAMHFTLKQQEGLEIFHQLRSTLSGWALPHYVVDSPLAEGKSLVN